METNKDELRAKLAELNKRFDGLRKQCNGFVRISPATIQEYKDRMQKLEAQLN